MMTLPPGFRLLLALVAFILALLVLLGVTSGSDLKLLAAAVLTMAAAIVVP